MGIRYILYFDTMKERERHPFTSGYGGESE